METVQIAREATEPTDPAAACAPAAPPAPASAPGWWSWVVGADPRLGAIVAAAATLLVGGGLLLGNPFDTRSPEAPASSQPGQAQTARQNLAAGAPDPLLAALAGSVPLPGAASGGATEVELFSAGAGGPAPSGAGEPSELGAGWALPPRAVRLAPVAPGPDAPTYINFVLDGSGSMLERTETGRPKIDQAKSVVAETMSGLPSGVYAGLRVFGHRIPESDKAASCRDTELAVPFLGGEAAGRSLAEAKVTPRGWTSLAENLRLAAADLPTAVNRAIVIVSDGKETCGGDPIAAARVIREDDPSVRIYTVGFAVDSAAREQLRAIASVGGGSYEDAGTHPALVEALRRISNQSTARGPTM